MLKTQQPLKRKEKIKTDLESLEFQKFFDVCLTNLKTIKFYFKKSPKIYTGNQVIYLVKDPHYKCISLQFCGDGPKKFKVQGPYLQNFL